MAIIVVANRNTLMARRETCSRPPETIHRDPRVARAKPAVITARSWKGGHMILGMSLSTFTLVHVVLSLVGILAGLIVLFAMFGSKSLDGWTALFLATTVLTSVTGFFFPADRLLPSHVVGIVSLIVLAVALFARYAGHLAGPWRWIYVITSVLALYLNVFVAVAQSFQKLSPLHSLAPTQSEPPFLIAQLVVLVIFIVLAVFAVRSFHPAPDARTLNTV